MSAPPALNSIKALTFDVFGTTVNWRSSVEQALAGALSKATETPSATIPADVLSRAKSLTKDDVARFAQEWRKSYGVFTRGFVPGVTPWKDIDTHHYDSLVEQLERWQLAGLFPPDVLRDLSLVWHHLVPWKDSAAGLQQLGKRLATSTLSNGNQSLLHDLNEFGSLGFQHITSAADFHAYKPHSSVYLGAAKKLGVEPTEIAMVAAHLDDLTAAHQNGLRTIYVERPGEEDWATDDERYMAARGFVDLWIGQTEDGFREVARRLGL